MKNSGMIKEFAKTAVSYGQALHEFQELQGLLKRERRSLRNMQKWARGPESRKARKMGAAVLLLEQNQHAMRDKKQELRDWKRWKRSEFFLKSIRREKRRLVSESLKLQSIVGLLEIDLEKSRSDVQLLARGGKIVVMQRWPR